MKSIGKDKLIAYIIVWRDGHFHDASVYLQFYP